MGIVQNMFHRFFKKDSGIIDLGAERREAKRLLAQLKEKKDKIEKSTQALISMQKRKYVYDVEFYKNDELGNAFEFVNQIAKKTGFEGAITVETDHLHSGVDSNTRKFLMVSRDILKKISYYLRIGEYSQVHKKIVEDAVRFIIYHEFSHRVCPHKIQMRLLREALRKARRKNKFFTIDGIMEKAKRIVEALAYRGAYRKVIRENEPGLSPSEILKRIKSPPDYLMEILARFLLFFYGYEPAPTGLSGGDIDLPYPWGGEIHRRIDELDDERLKEWRRLKEMVKEPEGKEQKFQLRLRENGTISEEIIVE